MIMNTFLNPLQVISNKDFTIQNNDFKIRCGSRYTPYDPYCVNISNRLTQNENGYIESFHPYAPTNGSCIFRIGTV